eukprot:10962252-Alexandrium_andersonii.AAC.1
MAWQRLHAGTLGPLCQVIRAPGEAAGAASLLLRQASFLSLSLRHCSPLEASAGARRLAEAVIHRPLRRGLPPSGGAEAGPGEDMEADEEWQGERDPSALCPWGWDPLEDCPDCGRERAERRGAAASADPNLH